MSSSSSAPRLAPSTVPLRESVDEPLQPISHRLLGHTPPTGNVPGAHTGILLSVSVGGSGGGQPPLHDVSPDDDQPDRHSGCTDPRWDDNARHGFCRLADVSLLTHIMPSPMDGVQLGCTSKWTPSVHTSRWIRIRVLYDRGVHIGRKRERSYAILFLSFASFRTSNYSLVLFATGDST
jgi:hypothetical protein